MRRGNRLLVLMVLTLLVLYGAIGFIQYRQHEDLSQVVQRSDRGVQRGFTQFEVEYQRLGNALNHRLFEPQGMPLEELLVRYEVFVSRIGLLESDKAQEVILDKKLLADLNKVVKAFVAQGDLVLAPGQNRIPPNEELLTLRDQFKGMSDMIRELSFNVTESTATGIDRRATQIREQVRVTFILTVFQGLLTLALAIAVLRQYRHRRKAQREADASQLALVEAAARLETEAVQLAARHELQEITQSLPLVVYRLKRNVDATGAKYTYVSDRAQELMGVSPAAMMQGIATIDAYVHPDDKAAVAAETRLALKELRRYSQEFRILLPNGEVRWMYCESIPRMQEDGQILSTGYIQPIDNIKARERALVEVTEQQRVIFDNVPSGLIFSADGAIRQFNAGFATMMGVPGMDLSQRTADMMFPSEREHNAFNAHAVPLLEQGLTVVVEQEFCRINGPRFMGRIVGRRVSVAEFERATIWILDDISERKQAEDAMRRAKELAEETTRLKGDFLANMSHEIRTPMNAIIGLSHLALKTDLNPRQRDYLQKIGQSGRHLLGVINDILDFSKVESGRLDVEHTPFRLDDVMDNLANVIFEKASSKNLELIFDVSADVPRQLVGDPLRLGQVLINYANNAVKFTEQGEIDIVIRLDRPSDQAVWLRFEVRDTGIGMSQEQMGRLFQSFMQGDTSTTRRYGGTGLGLVISKGLVELMGGEVGVSSEPGKGSTFWFTARLGLGESTGPNLLPKVDLRGRRVLVVDDNDNAAHVLVDMLSMIGFEVTSVNSGQGAIDAVTRAAQSNVPFDIVLMDWQMPVMDGLEAARRIAELPLPQIPQRLMVTAYGREELIRGAAKVGIADVLVKPVSASLLFDTMMRVIGQDPTATRAVEALPDTTFFDALKDLRGARILLVEDNELNQQVAVELLQEAGFVVDVADDGQKAVDQVRRLVASGQNFDLVLMDMQMPVMDGIEATELLRQDMRNDRLPILAMTANVMPGDRERCRLAGMNDFLGKPIEPDELWRALKTWIAPRPGLPVIASDTTPEPLRFQAPVEESGALPEGVAGLDVALGLGHAMGKKPLYLRLLRMFVSSHGSIEAGVMAALARDDWTQAQRLAHTLKGVAANIGATALQVNASALESSIAQRAPRAEIQTQLAATEGLLVALVGALRLALQKNANANADTSSGTDPAGAAAVSASVDMPKVRSVCKSLMKLLADDDAAATEVFETHSELLRAALGGAYVVVENGIHNFEFATAMTEIEAFLSAA